MATVIDKTDLLNKLEQQTEQHLKTAIGVFQNLNEHELLRPSQTGGWSIAQCLWHLNSYAWYYLPLIEISMVNKSEGSPVFKSTWLGSYFTRLMEPKASSKKFKAFHAHVPPRELKGYEVVAEFIRQEELLLKLLRQAKQTDLNKIRIPISISTLIRLRLGDVFGFYVAHHERHIQQALRNVGGSA